MSLRFFSVVGLLLVACGSSGDDNAIAGENAMVQASVGSDVGRPLPLKEVSGLGWRRVGGENQYLAIGDSTAKLVTFNVASTGRMTSIEEHDLQSIITSRVPQWEGVAGDRTGKVFLLAETDSIISVLDPSMRRVVHELKLTLPRSFPLAEAWAADENSRAEGLLLLANGHVIVAKEKDPPALIEFGPEGSEPEGYNADLALGDRAFPIPTGTATKLVALKHWLLKDADSRLISDISDLALDDEGRILALSDQGQAIARLERTLDPTEAKIDVKAVFTLPHRVDKPEGLIVAQGHPFVATDGRDVDDDAIYQLDPLP